MRKPQHGAHQLPAGQHHRTGTSPICAGAAISPKLAKAANNAIAHAGVQVRGECGTSNGGIIKQELCEVILRLGRKIEFFLEFCDES